MILTSLVASPGIDVACRLPKALMPEFSVLRISFFCVRRCELQLSLPFIGQTDHGFGQTFKDPFQLPSEDLPKPCSQPNHTAMHLNVATAHHFDFEIERGVRSSGPYRLMYGGFVIYG